MPANSAAYMYAACVRCMCVRDMPLDGLPSFLRIRIRTEATLAKFPHTCRPHRCTNFSSKVRMCRCRPSASGSSTKSDRSTIGLSPGHVRHVSQMSGMTINTPCFTFPNRFCEYIRVAGCEVPLCVRRCDLIHMQIAPETAAFSRNNGTSTRSTASTQIRFSPTHRFKLELAQARETFFWHGFFRHREAHSLESSPLPPTHTHSTTLLARYRAAQIEPRARVLVMTHATN